MAGLSAKTRIIPDFSSMISSKKPGRRAITFFRPIQSDCMSKNKA
jgi:hypothetical protein